MMIKKNIHETEAFESALLHRKKEHYILRLYVTGMTPRSTQAITTVKKICEEHLEGRYSLGIIDLFQQPSLAKGDQIVAVPTLIKQLPLPLRRIIGELSTLEQVLVGLDLRKKSCNHPESI